MSILKKPYEISVWDDVWDESKGKFVEKRLGIVGTDTMEYQGRAIEPNFTRNVNGVKKLTFKMYKKFKDSITGEKVDNEFVDWLVSERKVKLKYGVDENGKDYWHDFIIKNISENSSNYLYTYQLEDALVQELSKNGFGMTLDAELMNNLGTANELAEYVLQETDWEVSEDSEAFIQTIDESLIYVTIPEGTVAKHIKDQSPKNRKVGLELDDYTFSKDTTALAFYSSCTSKPYRFQFIWIDDLKNLTRDKNDRTITNSDCQYYIDEIEESEYEQDKETGYWLPREVTVTSYNESEDSNAPPVNLSYLYRGKRYGFAQKTQYIPVLDKYVNIYSKDGVKKYGYLKTEYKSPALTQNIISNTSFESTSGWTGTHMRTKEEEGEGEVKNTPKAKIENVYGYFKTEENSTVFHSALDDLGAGSFNDENGYLPYLKVTFDGSNSAVVNSGPFDNRISIGELNVGDKWALKYEVLDASGDPTSDLNFYLKNCKFSSSTNGYKQATNSDGECLIEFKDSGTFIQDPNNEEYSIATVEKADYSPEEFKKKMNVRLCIQPKNLEGKAVYYIKTIELFKAIYNGTQLIKLEEQGETVQDRVINRSYYYFDPDQLNEIDNKEQLVPETVSDVLLNSTYKPVFNDDGQKVRSVSVKESNYFNILQSISETFEAWLLLETTRDDYGAVLTKKIKFKNYVGKDNYAGFRYGVNLQNIQRTFESKGIVTKLMVKANSNEHGQNGFCTIARAKANPTGESYIYDFQYYLNRGLLDARIYLQNVYIPSKDLSCGADMALYLNKKIRYSSKDTPTDSDWYDVANSDTKVYSIGEIDGETIVWSDPISYDSINLSGYFVRLKALNEEIQEQNEILINTAKDITKYKADLEIAESGHEAALAGLEEVMEDFFLLTDKSVDNLKDSTDPLLTRSDVKKLMQEYLVHKENEKRYSEDEITINNNLTNVQNKYNSIKAIVEQYAEQKRKLNQEFFSQYSRFIQEGTWISEEYVDDEKYYADALSVMYNSCYPQVAYTINVLELSKLQGYEKYSVGLGDKTYVEDPEFFGDNLREEVIVSESSENLDDPSKNKIKVQNFKNQFQDLFQKITATVQQAQYNTGSYEKAVALAEANQGRKQQFLTEALDSASARLSAAGQQSVTWGNDGITVKSVDSPCDAIRMVGGAILLSKQDENGQQKWVTGVTSDGVSASLITAGVVNTGEIALMNYDEPVFRWDTFGISAYDAEWMDTEAGSIVKNVNSKKFVRFDKYGIYGINEVGNIDGASWKPGKIKDIDDNATFALTWDGLKVSNSAVELHIGDNAKTNAGNYNILDVRNKDTKEVIFAIKENGSLIWGSGSASTKALYTRTLINKPTEKYEDYTDNYLEDDVNTEIDERWHKIKAVEDWYVSYSHDGGNTWDAPIQIQSADTAEIIEWYYATGVEGFKPTRESVKWSLTPSDAGHSAVNKYLWNYEETKLTNGTSKYTVPALINTQPKEISKIYEFYAVDTNNDPPDKPVISGYDSTNKYLFEQKEDGTKVQITLGDWECVDTSTTEASGKILNQSQHLWNFSVIVFTDNSVSIGSIANIGTGGKGISSVQNWYKRTSTEASKPGKPASLTDAQTNWSTTLPAYANDNCYLWTCESTVYSDSGTPTFTDVTLLSREPRNIDTITEYYYVGTGTPNNITLKNNNNEIDSYATGTGVVWEETYDTPEHGESLWNCEVIKYSTKDEKGENLYKVIPAARIGYIGVETYTLALDNDADMVVKSSDGTWISTGNIVVNPTKYEGHNISNEGVLEITAPDDGNWSSDNYSTTDDKLTITINKITSETGGEFTFKWKSSNDEGASVYAEKKFRLGVTTSLADYDLIIPQTVINSSQSKGEYTISVLKKSKNGTTTLYGPRNELKLYKNDEAEPVKTIDEEGDDKDNWVVQKYEQNHTTPIKYTLKSADGSIIWDEEVVEFTQDGASVQKINTYLREFPYEKTNESAYGWTTPTSEGGTAFVDIDHKETWTTGREYDNSHIRVGDTAYLVGVVTDRFSAEGQRQNITLYGKVVDKDVNGITMITTAVIWGGTQGDKGDTGGSPYIISLNNDFVSVPATSEGEIATEWNVAIKPTVYCGITPLEWKQENSGWNWEQSSGLGLFVTASHLKSEIKDDTCVVKELSDNRGTITFTLKKDGTKVAQTTFEAIKQLAGAPGTYVYMLVEPNVLEENNLSDISLTTYERVGAGEPAEKTGYYYSYKIDNGEILSLDGNIIASTNLTSLKNKLQVYCYSDNDRKILIDKETIEVVKEIKRDWYLYSSSTERPTLPDGLNWSDYPATDTDGKWQKTQDDNSKWYTCKGGAYTSEEQKTKAWCGPYRLDAQAMTYDDWFAALKEETENDPSAGIYVLTNGDESKVAVSADILRGGAIKIGEANKPAEECTFYAAMDNSKVYLAGWEVSTYYLKRGELGKKGSIILSTEGILNSEKYFNSDNDKEKWMLAIGQNFGVTEDGELYCTGGNFAGWEVDDSYLRNGNLYLYGATSTNSHASLISNTNSKIVLSAGQKNDNATNASRVINQEIPLNTIILNKKTMTFSIPLDGSEKADDIASITDINITFNAITSGYDQQGLTFNQSDISASKDNGEWKITGTYNKWQEDLDDDLCEIYYVKCSYTKNIKATPIILLEDGSLYAEAIHIAGNSNLGGWQVTNNSIKNDNVIIASKDNNFDVNGKSTNAFLVAGNGDVECEGSAIPGSTTLQTHDIDVNHPNQFFTMDENSEDIYTEIFVTFNYKDFLKKDGEPEQGSPMGVDRFMWKQKYSYEIDLYEPTILTSYLIKYENKKLYYVSERAGDNYGPYDEFPEYYGSLSKLRVKYTNNKNIVSFSYNNGSPKAKITFPKATSYDFENFYYRIPYKTNSFIAFDDGTFHGYNSVVHGAIHASSGELTNLKINDRIYTDTVSIGKDIVLSGNGVLRFNGLIIENGTQGIDTLIKATGELKIGTSENSSSLTFTNKTPGDDIYTIKYLQHGWKFGGFVWFQIYISPTPTQEMKLTLYYDKVSGNYGKKHVQGTREFTFGPDKHYETFFIDDKELNTTWGKDYIGYSVKSFDDAAKNRWLIDDYISREDTYTVPGNGNANILVKGNLIPDTDSATETNGYNLGEGEHRWNTIFARNGQIQISDEKKKKEIREMGLEYDIIFNNIVPISYKLINSNNNRTHTGFSAQNVKNSVLTAGLTTQDFAAYCEWEEDDEVGCGLRYSEFVALNTWQIQKLKPRVSTLEQTILNYETRISNLENELQNLKNS